MGEHIPVLLEETIEGLKIKPRGIYFDLTLGRAGHSSRILSQLTTGHLYGIDQDEEAIEESQKKLSKIGKNFTLIHSNFVNLSSILEELDVNYVDGILMDLGVSSPQFDEGERGFSYNYNAKLDMRMDRSQTLTAEEIVNTYPLKSLITILRDYGEERFALSIAKNIVKARENDHIETTFQLVDIIKKSLPSKELKKVGHPAKQTFQALRIAVNDELNVLEKTLTVALEALRPHGGRLAIITFHSLEDRLVKLAFRKKAIVEGNRFDGPMMAEAKYRLVNSKPIIAGSEELSNNHRASSAKLRIIERL